MSRQTCQEILYGLHHKTCLSISWGDPHFTYSPCQESSVGQSIFCVFSATQLEKPFAVGGHCFKEQSLPRTSGNANLLMDISWPQRHSEKHFRSSRQELASASFCKWKSKSVFNYSTIKHTVLVPLFCALEHCFCGLRVFNNLAWSWVLGVMLKGNRS